MIKKFDKQFDEIAAMIYEARYDAIKSVNAELVRLYWNVGGYISKKIESAQWAMVWSIDWRIISRAGIRNLKVLFAEGFTG